MPLNIDQVADSKAELLKVDTAATLADLAGYVIERIENSLEHVDDSHSEIDDIIYLRESCISRPARWHGRNPSSLPSVFFDARRHCLWSVRLSVPSRSAMPWTRMVCTAIENGGGSRAAISRNWFRSNRAIFHRECVNINLPRTLQASLNFRQFSI
jgi:hypothetical protein